jgi:hypothetical protein
MSAFSFPVRGASQVASCLCHTICLKDGS